MPKQRKSRVLSDRKPFAQYNRNRRSKHGGFMSNNNASRQNGDAFHARLFWDKALELLDTGSGVFQLGFEIGPKGFDDLWVEYATGGGPQNQSGQTITREHVQCKWHQNAGEYEFTHLADPNFINATTTSFLQRALAAQRQYAPDGVGVRFVLHTNWAVAEPLRSMIRAEHFTLDLDVLFSGKTENSTSGKIRACWRTHLGIDEAELRLLAGKLVLAPFGISFTQVRKHLDRGFALMGLRRTAPEKAHFPWDYLPHEWLKQGHYKFNRAQLREKCRKEGLFESTPAASGVFAIQTFTHSIDKLERHCDDWLDLTACFDANKGNRALMPGEDWAGTIYPRVHTFLNRAALSGRHLRLLIESHVTLAFAAGSILNSKSRRVVEVAQNGLAPNEPAWGAEDLEHDPAWAAWQVDVTDMNEAASDIAIGVSLTIPTKAGMELYIAENGLKVGRMIHAQIARNLGSYSVKCGRHAFELANALAQTIRDERSRCAGYQHPVIHLFIAAPNGFAFFLGQMQNGMGKVQLYEFDYGRTTQYRPSLALPLDN